MATSDSHRPPTDSDDDVQVWDSQCWFPPLELAALVAAGALPAGVPVLDVGCGAGVEVIFLAKRGWPAYGIDKDRSLIAKAAGLASPSRAGALPSDGCHVGREVAAA